MHLETIKSKQVKVKRVISQILKEIPEEMHRMETLFMPQLRTGMDSMQKERLCDAIMEH